VFAPNGDEEDGTSGRQPLPRPLERLSGEGYFARMERPITRSLLATFIEYAARGRVTPIEWSRFIIAHYGDNRMETARRDCARLLGGSQHRSVPKSDLDFLDSVAQELRASDDSK
jgi:hypothetical protein